MEWTRDDREQLRVYKLNTKDRLIQFLRAQVPKITAKSFEEVALQANRAQGASDIIDAIEQAASPIIERQSTMEHVDITAGLPK